MSFNEGFCIPVPANALAVCALQLSVCSLGPQAQEELLVRLRVLMMDNERMRQHNNAQLSDI